MLFTKIKKMSFLRLAAAAMIAAFALVMGACDNPVGSDPSIVTPPIQQPRTPVITDFVGGYSDVDIDHFENLTSTWVRVWDGSEKAVDIKPKDGKTKGEITVFYDNRADGGSLCENPPTERGTYSITFNVAAWGNYGAHEGFYAGTLKIVDGVYDADLFDFEGLGDRSWTGSPIEVTITSQIDNEVTDLITVWYTGNKDTTYARNDTAPTAPGTYEVTFSVKAWGSYGATEADLVAGELNITVNTPEADDYDIPKWDDVNYSGEVQTVSGIKAKDGKSPGNITYEYYLDNNKIDEPKNAGTYTVKFNVESATGWLATEEPLDAGMFEILPITLAEEDFEITGLNPTYNKEPHAVTAEPKTVRSIGVNPVISNDGNTDGGTYNVYLVVEKGGNYNKSTITVKQVINPYKTVEEDFTIPSEWYYKSDGSVKEVNDITINNDLLDGGIVVFYNGATDVLPKGVGTYTVTFNFVPSNLGNNAVFNYTKDDRKLTIDGKDLNDGDYYYVSNEETYNGSSQAAIVMPNGDGLPSPGSNPSYEGTNGTTYAKTTTPPTNAGEYKVTITVAAAGDYNGATDLPVGTFKINKAPFDLSNFVGNPGSKTLPATWEYTEGEVETIIIAAKDGLIGMGAVTPNGNATTVGTHTITFTVAVGLNYEGTTSSQNAGTLTVKSAREPSNDADLDSFTITASGTTYSAKKTDIPVANTEIPSQSTNPQGPFIVIQMPQAEITKAATTAVTILATPKDDNARVTGYAVGSGSGTVNKTGDTGWTTTGIENGFTTTVANNASIFVRVKAENGDVRFFRVLKIDTKTASTDAKLKSITINTVTMTTSNGLPTANPASGASNNPSSSAVPNTSTVKFKLNSNQYNGGKGLKIKAEPNDPGAKIVGYAIGSSTNITMTTSTWNTYGKYDDGGIKDEFPLADYTSGSSRIFVWVKAENGDNGIYRINDIEIDNSTLPQKSNDASLSSFFINDVAVSFSSANLSPLPPTSDPNKPDWGTSFQIIMTLTGTDYNDGTLKITATTTDSNATIMGYTITNSSTDIVTDDVNQPTKWNTRGVYAPEGFGNTYTKNPMPEPHNSTNKLVFVWVRAEDGTDGFYRVNLN